MNEPEVLASPELINDGAYPIYFGISCAFAGLHLVSTARRLDDGLDRWSRMGDTMLQGSSHLLGLLVGRAQRKVEVLEAEVRELKRQRSEDAKANEKVVGIFATHEQSWIAERKQLRIQAQSLLIQLRDVKMRSDQAVSDWSKRVEEAEQVLQLKDQALEEESKRMTEFEVKLVHAEDVTLEMNERAKKEAQDHSSELWKHKTAFAKLVSSQRQLEADLALALRQADAAKQELGEVLEQKEAAVSVAEKLSGEIAKIKKDAEQKENILSAVLRKSKLDVTEKQMLLKEVKITKAKKKQAELDSNKWRGMWESRNKKSSKLLKSVDTGSSEERRPEFQLKSTEYHPRTLLLEFLEDESRKERKSPGIITTVHCLDQYLNNETNCLGDIQHSQDWVRLETEKYVTILEKRQFADIEAFMEQMRLKDEKLETFHRKLLSMELESKRLKSHIKELDGSLLQLTDENLKLGDMLLDREEELKSLEVPLNLYVHYWKKSNSNATWASETQAVWPEVKNTMKTSKDKEQIRRSNTIRKYHMEESLAQERDDQNTNNEDTKLMQLESPYTTSSHFSPPNEHFKDYPIIYINELSSEEPITTDSSTEESEKIMTLITQTPNEEIEEEKEVSMDPVHICKQISFHETTEISDKPASTETTFTAKVSTWKMDIHALGVSYKIKRLIQQLLVLEKVAGAQAMKLPMIREDTPDGSKEGKVHTSFQTIKGLPLVMSLLNKHVKRYQSLEEKTDDLCRRMHESYRTRSSRDANNNKKEQTEMLEGFLEETFQLQRYIVATGQKLLQIQSMISCSFAGINGFDKSGFNMRQFADIVRNLLTEIQRGLEVRISRVIGDLEGTLAYDGILRS